MKEFITMTEIRATSTWSVKDDSPRGCKTVSNSEVKPGDMVVYENRFTLVIDDPETEAAETETTTRTPEEVTAAIMENTNFLTLNKCAYIFDSTYGNFFYGTAEQHKQRRITQAAMRKYYYHPEKLLEKFPYTLNENGDPVIIFNGNPHRLNALQIATISDPESIINHRRHIDPDEIIKETPHFHRFSSVDIYSNKFRTLNFEFFTGSGELGYIRVHFKGSHEQFIIDDRNGELYTSGEYGQHKPTTAATIAARLGIESAAARAEFYEVINAITKTRRNNNVISIQNYRNNEAIQQQKMVD